MYIVILAAHFNSFSGPLIPRHRRCQAVSPSIHHITARAKHIYTQSFSVRVRSCPHIAQKASQLLAVPWCWWAFSPTPESPNQKHDFWCVSFLVERDCDSARIIIIYQKIQKSYLMYLFIIRREWRRRRGPLSRSVIIFASKMIGSLSLSIMLSQSSNIIIFLKFSIKIITFVIRNSLKRETWGNWSIISIGIN